MIEIPSVNPTQRQELLEDAKVCGCLVVHTSDEAASRLLVSAPTTVLLNIGADLLASRIVPDETGAAALVARHLMELGHRRIVFCLGTQMSGASALALRMQGVEETVKNQSQGAFSTMSSPQQLLECWNSKEIRPTAVIADTLSTAIELLRVCTLHGIKVPGDLSLATFDDADPADKLAPTLTAIAMPVEQMAHEAATLLIDQIEAQQSIMPRKILMRQSLIIRESTGAVPTIG